MDPDMAQSEAEPPTSSGMGNPPIRTPGAASGGPDRPILGPTVALVAILLAVLVLLVGGGLFLRQLTASPTPIAAAPTTLAVSAPTVSAAPTAPPRTLAAATLPPASSGAATPLPTLKLTAAPTALPTSATQPAAALAGQTAEPSPLPT